MSKFIINKYTQMTEKPNLVRTDGSGTNYNNDRLELLWAMIVYSTSHLITPMVWISEIQDHKGDLTVTWNYNPPKLIKDIITNIWRNFFNETNINHVILDNE